MCPCMALKLPEHVRHWSKVVHTPSSAGQNLFAVVFFPAPFVSIFAHLSPDLLSIQCLPLYLLRVYGASVVLQSRKMKMAFTSPHACRAVGAGLCSLSCAGGSFGGWVTGKQAPCHPWGVTEICDKTPTLPDSSLLLPGTHTTASRREVVHCSKRSDTWFSLTAILDLKHKRIFNYFVTRCWQVLKDHTERM